MRAASPRDPEPQPAPPAPSLPSARARVEAASRRRWLCETGDNPPCPPIEALLRRGDCVRHFLAEPALVLDEAHLDETGAKPLLQVVAQNEDIGDDGSDLDALQALLSSSHADKLQVRGPTGAMRCHRLRVAELRKSSLAPAALGGGAAVDTRRCSDMRCRTQHVPASVTAHRDLGGYVFEGATPAAAAILHTLACPPDDPIGAFCTPRRPDLFEHVECRQEIVELLLEHERASAGFVEIGPMIRFGDHREHLLALVAYLCHVLPLQKILLVRVRLTGACKGRRRYSGRERTSRHAGCYASVQLP